LALELPHRKLLNSLDISQSYDSLNIASSNLQSNNFNSNNLFKNDTSSTTLLSTKIEADIGLVLTRYIITKQSSSIYKYTCIVIVKEKARIKKNYFY
jgi:hypothetical protein